MTASPAQTAYPWRAMPRPRTTSPTSRRRGSASAARASASRPTKSALLREPHDAPEARFEGGRRPVQLVAVERHAGLQAERVARPEPDGDEARGAAGRDERVPHRGPRRRVHEELEAVLAGVAGACDEGRDPGHASLRDPVVVDRSQVEVGERGQDPRRLGTLDGDEGGRQRPVVEDCATGREALGEGVGDDGRVGRVGDDEEPILRQAIDDEVVEDPAVGSTDHRVVRASDIEGARLGRHGGGQRVSRLRAFHEELAHVGQVEEPGMLADRAVLLDDAGVLDRHPPAGVVDHPGPERLVTPSERRGARLVRHRRPSLLRRARSRGRRQPGPRARRAPARSRR